eukprot:snap_masked-scaffold_5-processed-gene-13.46-mRNA-1 protein AED:0.85 eAED:1.00 QI:0/0/0/0.5/1/1/2/0/70
MEILTKVMANQKLHISFLEKKLLSRDYVLQICKGSLAPRADYKLPSPGVVSCNFVISTLWYGIVTGITVE